MTTEFAIVGPHYETTTQHVNVITPKIKTLGEISYIYILNFQFPYSLLVRFQGYFVADDLRNELTVDYSIHEGVKVCRLKYLQYLIHFT